MAGDSGQVVWNTQRFQRRMRFGRIVRPNFETGCPMPLSTPLRALIVALLLAPPWARAAEPSVAEVAAAVLAYESGRLDEARAAFGRLSAAGSPLADYNLAVMHLRGEMPNSSVAEAERLLRRAAEHGFVTAMYTLGQFFESGQRGKPDLVQANVWYERSALAGSVDGQVAIGTAYYLGRGAPKDPVQAARWYREAAKGGDVGAQYLIASMYEQGDGVERDLRLARYWYAVAAANRDEAAPDKVKEIDARLAAEPS